MFYLSVYLFIKKLRCFFNSRFTAAKCLMLRENTAMVVNLVTISNMNDKDLMHQRLEAVSKVRKDVNIRHNHPI